MSDENDFVRACHAILRCDRANGSAKAYAKAGLGLAHDPNARRVQALYLLSNIQGWRGPQSKEARAALKRIGEVRKR